MGLTFKAASVPESPLSKQVIKKWQSIITNQMSQMSVKPASPVFIRIFKQEAELELWVKGDGSQWLLYKTFSICTFSGQLGPKQREGDFQSPEGFYFVTPQRLNPWSQFHLSFNLGYPNAYDRYYSRTGSALMVHGDCVSVGCYAMTDEGIEEIYTVMSSALTAGQPFVRVHVFPFRMNKKNMQRHSGSKWLSFWKNLKTGYDWFEDNNTVPNVEVKKGRYVFTDTL